MDTRPHLLIGLDGLCFNEINDWLNDGTLPTLSSLISEGAASELQSTVPPWTPCAWPSLLSGHNPGKHGVFDFFTRDDDEDDDGGYKKRLIDRNDVHSPYLFEFADGKGRTSIVINYPVTHPASQLEHGAIVPGYIAPEDATFHPEWVREAYEEEYGNYRIYPEYGESASIDSYQQVARGRLEMAHLLSKRFDWDLLAVQFQVTDTIFHDLDDRSKIREVLKTVDACVGDIISLADDDSIVYIVSDHGMGDYDWTFYANSWLKEHGYCETTTDNDIKYFSQVKNDLRGANASNSQVNNLTAAILDFVFNAFSIVGLTPQRIHNLLSSLGLASNIEQIVPPQVVIAAQTQTVDWGSSTAFQLYFNSLGIHLNIPKNKYKTKYKKTRKNLIEELNSITDPDGKEVFENVHPRESIYHGDQVRKAPDIICIPRSYKYDVSGTLADTFRRNPHKNHKPNGIFITNHPNMSFDEPLSVYDVAPTVAASMGLPVDTASDGEVQLESKPSAEESWAENTNQYTRATTDVGADDVEERLENLGYMN